MFSIDQLVAHLVGDYILQSHWMATNKTKNSLAAAIHCLFYVLPFLLLSSSIVALSVITLTHFVVDRWRLARYVVYLKNLLAPKWDSWNDCRSTGYHKDVPDWLSVWLLIITDNVIHIIINGLALFYL